MIHLLTASESRFLKEGLMRMARKSIEDREVAMRILKKLKEPPELSVISINNGKDFQTVTPEVLEQEFSPELQSDGGHLMIADVEFQVTKGL